MLRIVARIVLPLLLIAAVVTLWLRSYTAADVFLLGGWGGQMNGLRCDRGLMTIVISSEQLGDREFGVLRHTRTPPWDGSSWFASMQNSGPGPRGNVPGGGAAFWIDLPTAGPVSAPPADTDATPPPPNRTARAGP